MAGLHHTHTSGPVSREALLSTLPHHKLGLGDPVGSITKQSFASNKYKKSLKMHKQNFQGWWRTGCKLSYLLCVFSYTAGHPRNTLSQDLRTEVGMFSKAPCHCFTIHLQIRALRARTSKRGLISMFRQHVSSELQALDTSTRKHFQQSKLLALTWSVLWLWAKGLALDVELCQNKLCCRYISACKHWNLTACQGAGLHGSKMHCYVGSRVGQECKIQKIL